MMNFTARTLRIQDLLVDPNNYRFLDNPDYKRKLATRYHTDAVQETTIRMLEKGSQYQLRALRDSILSNGYVPMERIIVIPYPHSTTAKYLVVEGNRRVAALKTIIRDARDGIISLTKSQETQFLKVPCAILEAGAMGLKEAERVIKGIRHIAGPREWGAYQQAQLIYELVEEQKMEFSAISEHIGMYRNEVSRRYRALKALKTMENDEDYADDAKPEFYRFFHELIALPVVRDRFGWNHESYKFDNMVKAKEFFELIAPQNADIESKIKTYMDVRKLKLIIGNPRAEASLFDQDQSFTDALACVESQASKSSTTQFASEMSRFHQMLNELAVDALKGLSEEDIELLRRIISVIEDRIDTYEKIQR